MASKSEITFGTKIANAEAIATHVKSFTDFVPPTENTSMANYETLIGEFKGENNSITSKKTSYSNEVDTRQKLFFKNLDSVNKSLSPITSAVKAKLGKSAKPVATLTALVVKIRGEKKAKPKDPKADDAVDKKKEDVSQSQRSFASITQHFTDIVTTVTDLGTDYAPVNDAHKLPALNAKLIKMKEVNDGVTSAYGILKTGFDNRTVLYADLADRTQRIKEQVKSQYGVASTEYKLIKGLKV
jgi:hypothetical protein